MALPIALTTTTLALASALRAAFRVATLARFRPLRSCLTFFLIYITLVLSSFTLRCTLLILTTIAFRDTLRFVTFNLLNDNFALPAFLTTSI